MTFHDWCPPCSSGVWNWHGPNSSFTRNGYLLSLEKQRAQDEEGMRQAQFARDDTLCSLLFATIASSCIGSSSFFSSCQGTQGRGEAAERSRAAAPEEPQARGDQEAPASHPGNERRCSPRGGGGGGGGRRGWNGRGGGKEGAAAGGSWSGSGRGDPDRGGLRPTTVSSSSLCRCCCSSFFEVPFLQAQEPGVGGRALQ